MAALHLAPGDQAGRLTKLNVHHKVPVLVRRISRPCAQHVGGWVASTSSESALRKGCPKERCQGACAALASVNPAQRHNREYRCTEQAGAAPST